MSPGPAPMAKLNGLIDLEVAAKVIEKYGKFRV
jgi:hypothetical protein